METVKNPLESVQLIPIFNYLNILSDFLFMETFLPEDDQNKQIPIVNALYEYLEHHENNKFKQDELIRNLLKGSDLYGEKEDENFDAMFVNAMLDYIITSLVFDKYGNIYGFLANIFCKAENLQLDEVLNLIIKVLKNAFFENEYGDNSSLTSLSVDRIYNEIILPLFPQPNANVSLLSIDHIYAQAGLMFLRAGRKVNTYHIPFENNVSRSTEDVLFDEYLVIGHVIEKLILTKEDNFDMLKCFALPALSYYVFQSKYLFVYEDMAHVISDTNFWQTAYRLLFQYTAVAFKDIEVQLQNDYTFKLHTALFGFQSRTALAETFMEQHCANLDENERILELLFYLQYPESHQCKVGSTLPNINECFRNQIDNITKIYEVYDLQLIREVFPKSLLDKLEDNEVVIKLYVPNNTTETYFPKSHHLSYVFLEFYFPRNISFDYYLLKEEDYSVMLVHQMDVLQQFKEGTNIHFGQLYGKSTIKTIKTAAENITEFFQNMVKYKSSQLQSSLEFLDDPQGDKLMDQDWWKEFGLSLVPYYPCLSDTTLSNYGKNCAGDKIKFLYKYEDEALKIINTNTHSLLASWGTSIRSVFLKNASCEAVDEILPKDQIHFLLIQNVVNKTGIFEDIAQHIKDPGFPLTFTTAEGVNLFEKIIGSLSEKTTLQFISVLSSLLKISILKSNFYRSVATIGENKVRLTFVHTVDNKSDTGYGYKFIFLSEDISKIAQLRTDYKLKNEVLLSPIFDSAKNETMLTSLSKKTFEPESDIYHESNHRIQKKPIKVLFSGIPIQADDYDEKCNDNEYFEKWKKFYVCRRRQRFSEKTHNEEEAVKFIKENTRLSEQEIRARLEKYTFPDNTTLTEFVYFSLKNDSLEPTWRSKYIIKNPHVLSKLRYDFRFENHDIKEYDGTFRLSFLYSQTERLKIEEDTSIETIIKDYNEQKATFSVTFHDYYAIRNFATTGYRRITRDTREAKLMKDALYKLAIRQSDDPDEEFNSKLFRVESKPISFLETTSSSQEIILKKFTIAFPSAEAATRFSGYPAPGFINIMYEMEFSRPYARAKIEQFYEKKEEMVILLPGSKFSIRKSARVDIEGLSKVLILSIKFQHTDDEKYVWHKNIMNQISRIQF